MSDNFPSFNSTNSFVLTIFIKELNATHNIRVTQSMNISTIAIDLINKINLKYDWSEFWFWHPTEKVWLLPKSHAISQFKIQPYSKINFLRRFNVINIQLPDLQIRQLLLDFSKTVFQTSQIICKKFGIRHHEELSLQWRILKKNDSNTPVPNRRRISQSVSQQNIRQSSSNLINSNQINNINTVTYRKRFTRPVNLTKNSRNDFETLTPSPFTLVSPTSFFSIFDNFSQNEYDLQYFESFQNSQLSNSPKILFTDALRHQDITIFKTYKDRVNLQFCWMISELTLMEQAIGDYNNVLLLLRYKYHNYYCFNEKYDEIRINQIFHQAYWSVISGETDCSVDEAYLLGGILYQINKSSVNTTSCETINLCSEDLDKEIDVILDKLHFDLIGRCENEEQSESIEISGQLDLIKYPKSFLSRHKKYSAILNSNGINLLKSTESSCIIPIRGNEIRLYVKIKDKKYFIIEILFFKNNLHNIIEFNKTKESMEKVKIKFYNQQEFIRWATALRLLSKSINFSLLTNYQYEYRVVKNIVEMKSLQPNLKLLKINKEDENMNLVDMIGPRYNKPFGTKDIIQKIIFFGRSFKDYSKIEAKIAYIKCWLTLSNSGMYFLQVNINQLKETQLIGVGYNRLILADIDTGNITNSYEMNKINSWQTNWELECTMLTFSEGTWKIKFKNATECQQFHEYLGGYLFIIMRNSERYTELNEMTYRRLTARNIE